MNVYSGLAIQCELRTEIGLYQRQHKKCPRCGFEGNDIGSCTGAGSTEFRLCALCEWDLTKKYKVKGGEEIPFIIDRLNIELSHVWDGQ